MHRSVPLFALALICTACDEGLSGVDGAAPDATAEEASLPAPSASAAATPAADHIPGRYIVTFAAAVTDGPRQAGRLVADAGGKLLHTYSRALNGFAADLPSQAVTALQHNPNIARVEQDARVSLAGTTEVSAPWGLDRIDQRALPLSQTFSYASTGAGVSVYILDTGIRTTHADFGGRASVALDVINDGRNGQDCIGHGTHVAGTVGGAVFGVAKAVRLYSARVIDCNGSGAYSGMIAAIDWVVGNAPRPAIINMSIQGPVSSSLNTAIQNAVNAGVVVIAAAGNYSTDACNYSPASATAAITVAASTSTDTQASFSNYGRCVDLYAPGAGIRSDYFTSDTSNASMSGTSMAAPHVAGAAALYLEAHPMASATEVTSALLAAATSNALQGVGSGSANLLLYSGFEATVVADPPVDTATTVVQTPTSDAAPIARFSVSCSHTTCVFDGGASTDDHGLVLFQWNFGDGSTASGGSVQAVHDYAGRGRFNASLVVMDASNQADMAAKTVNIRKN